MKHIYLVGMVFLGVVCSFQTQAQNTCKKMALTFDDGPLPTHTQSILDILDQYQIRATFFVVGRNVRAYPLLAREVVLRGHDVGVHGDTHMDLTKMSVGQAEHDIQRAYRSLEKYSSKISYWRAPYGSIPRVSFPRSVGMTHVMWDIDSLDWKRMGVNSIVNRVVSRFHPNAVILLHDHVTYNRQAVPLIIEEGLRLGYQWDTVSNLHTPCEATNPVDPPHDEENQEFEINPEIIEENDVHLD